MKTKEDEILNCKMTLQKLSGQQVSLDKQKNQLTKNVEELVRQKENSEQNLNSCQMTKVK